MVERYLLDTSVVVRWYLEQDGYQDALAVRSAFAAGRIYLETVDFVRFELGHVLRNKGLNHGKLDRRDYIAATRSLDDAGIRVHVTNADVLERAAELAVDRNLRFFDALLVAWSLELGITVLTNDKGICNAVAGVARTQLLTAMTL